MIDAAIPERRPATVSDRLLRQFAALCFIVFVGLALWHGLEHQRLKLAVTLATLGIAIGTVGLVRPRAVRLIYAAGMAFAEPMGLISSRVLLAVLYYVVFTPIGFLLRLSRSDSLARRSAPNRESYWTEKRTSTDIRSYLRGY